MRNSMKILAIIFAVALASSLCTSCASSQKVSIEELCSLHGEYTDQLGNEYKYSYDLPSIKGNSEYINEINNQINTVYEQVKYNMDSMEKGYSLSGDLVWWKSTEYNGVTSLIVVAVYDDDFILYQIYNFDSQGNKVENSRILQNMNLTEDEFVSSAYDILDKFMTRDDINNNESIAELWEYARENTLSTDNCNADIPLLITEDGKLIFCAKCTMIAGAGDYYILFSLEDSAPVSLKEFQNF